MLFNKFLQAVFLIMYSTVLSIPLKTESTSNQHRNIFEIDGRNETSTSSLNATRGLKSKRTLSSKYIPQNIEILNQDARIKKSKSGAKRGLSVGLKIRVPSTPTYNKELDKLEEVLELAKMNLEGNLEQVLNASLCPKCDGEETPEPFIEKRRVKPAYKCDEWDAKYRLCILERNLGDTVTFYLSTGKIEEDKPKVTWKKEFHMRDSKSRTGFIIDPSNTPENIIIGKQGYELRISPVSETDIGYNLFSASLRGHENAQSKVYFMIRIVPTDLGFVYVGETIELNLRSFISIPAESFSFIWYMEKFGEHSTLPSNMRMSASGSSIKISELRQEQEGILACSLYTNLNFLATKKRFLMKDLIKNNDVLKSPPDHTLHFKETNPDRRKRYFKKFIRPKRNINSGDIERALMDFTSEIGALPESKKLSSTTHPYDDYNVEMDVGYPGASVQSRENFQGIIDNALSGESPVHPMDISVENSPVDVEENGGNGEAIDKYLDQSAFELQKDTSMLNNLRTDKGTNALNLPSGEQIPEAVNKMASLQNNLGNNPELTPIQQPFQPQNNYENGKNFLNVEIQNAREKYGSPTENSDIILNIERIRGPRQITAEEKISKLISSCFSDYECSGVATCVRSNLKQAGYCKCLPGFYGVGVFCREDIWLGKNNYGMEGLHNPDDVPYSSSLPIIKEIN